MQELPKIAAHQHPLFPPSATREMQPLTATKNSNGTSPGGYKSIPWRVWHESVHLLLLCTKLWQGARQFNWQCGKTWPTCCYAKTLRTLLQYIAIFSNLAPFTLSVWHTKVAQTPPRPPLYECLRIMKRYEKDKKLVSLSQHKHALIFDSSTVTLGTLQLSKGASSIFCECQVCWRAETANWR